MKDTVRATRWGLTGALLLFAAGLIQTFLGYAIPEWTGDKLAHVTLGLLTVALSLVACLCALRQRNPRLSALGRAACATGIAGSGVLCLTTVGRLAYLPGIVLLTAADMTIHDWRATADAIAANWGRVLVSLLGGCLLLAVAAGPTLATIAGGFFGISVMVAPWMRRRPVTVQ